MQAGPQWQARREAADGATVVSLHDDRPLSFATMFELLRESAPFRAWYAEELRSLPGDAFFWEHPPLTRDTLGEPAEFAIVNAPALARMSANPAPFREYFDDGACVVSFRNLGGDALLVAPVPPDADARYTHFAAFLHNAPPAAVDRLLACLGRASADLWGDRPTWLSTSGLGVGWLLLRFDASPKYYQYLPYRDPDYFGTLARDR